MYYIAPQNNSGGSFIVNDTIDSYVIVESDDFKNANTKFNELIEDYSYYCPCCGERWYGLEYSVDDLTLVETDGPTNAVLHQTDGTIQKITIDSQKIWDYTI